MVEPHGSTRPARTPWVLALALMIVAAACGQSTDDMPVSRESAAPAASSVAVNPTGPTFSASPVASATTQPMSEAPAAQPTVAATAALPAVVDQPLPEGVIRPEWLGTRPLPVDADGRVIPQPTPDELVVRRIPTIDVLREPAADAPFVATNEPLSNAIIARSTWTPECPVDREDLRYLTVSFWGFDERPHTGEIIVNAAWADAVVAIFGQLFDARYPIEEMRLVTAEELEGIPTGDGNDTTGFVCRSVRGGAGWSQHAYGLAIDVNPFINPYHRGEVVLPELAGAYLDRTDVRPGMLAEGSVVVQAFDAIGWGWGGRWNSLSDHMHFSATNR